MKRKHVITIEIAAEGKTDFGIVFLYGCIKNTITVLNGFRKCYSAKILKCEPEIHHE